MAHLVILFDIQKKKKPIMLLRNKSQKNIYFIE